LACGGLIDGISEVKKADLLDIRSRRSSNETIVGRRLSEAGEGNS
jgi:hypothetical protein